MIFSGSVAYALQAYYTFLCYIDNSFMSCHTQKIDPLLVVKNFLLIQAVFTLAVLEPNDIVTMN